MSSPWSNLSESARRAAVAAVAALALLFWADEARAQQGAITGRVVDASNLEPVVGAQVFLPGTDLGGLTDEGGRFRITGVPAGQHQVRVRLLGYRPTARSVTVRGGETTTLDVQLSVSAVALEEVVVTATGERRQREVGSAISTVNAAEAVERSAPTNLTNLLKGRSTGVSVQRSAGSVGTGDVIKIRGNTSIGLSNAPLVYIDGARVDTDSDTDDFLAVGGQSASRLNDLNPDDIESVEIIKGPAAAALYGTEAAAGVIRIETKSGTASGDTRFTFRVESGVNRGASTQFPSAYVNPRGLFGDRVDPGTFLAGVPGLLGDSVAVTDTLYQMNLLEPQIRPSPARAPGYGDPFRDGYVQTYGGSVRGGSDFLTYYLSGELDAQDGNLPNNEFDKYSVRGNFNIAPSDRLDISVSNGFTSNSLALPDNDNNGFGYIGVGMLGFPWATPITRADFFDGTAVETCPINYEVARVADRAGVSDLFVADDQSLLEQLGPCDRPGFGSRTFGDIATRTNQQNIERYTGSATGTYRPYDFLTGRLTVGYDEVANDAFTLTPVDPGRPFGTASEGVKTSFQEVKKNLTLEATSTLDLDLTGDLNAQTTVGGQWFRSINEATLGTGQTLPSGCTTVSCAVTTTAGETFLETITAGFFFQEQLGWKDRIYLTPAIRFDDNSAQGENLGLQELPSVSFSWIMNEEAWFPELFDQFRLRAAWGKAGLQPGPRAALSVLNPLRVTFGGRSLSGVSPIGTGAFPQRGPGNPILAPETTTEWEGGFDVSLVDGRLGLQATYYHQTTENSVVVQNLKPSFGFPGGQPTNVAEIVSQGIELGLDARAVDARGLSWDWQVNVSTNDGEITALDEPIVFGLGGSTQRHQEGFPFASYFDEPVTVSGGEVVVGEDEAFAGHPTPEWEGSVGTTLTLFERVTLYGLLDFAGGHQNYNNTESFACGFALGGGENGGVCGPIFEKEDGAFTEEARIKQRATLEGTSSPWIEDADYAKLRTVSVRLRLPESWVRPVGAGGGSLRLVGENLATFTGYTGLDPEISFGGSTFQATRADFLTAPPHQRFVATLSLTF